MDKDRLQPLQLLIAKNRTGAEWITERYIHSMFNEGFEIDGKFWDIDNQFAYIIATVYQPYTDLMLMPTDFRESLIMLIIKNNKTTK